LLTPAERRECVLLFGLMLIGMLVEALGVSMVIPALVLLTDEESFRSMAWAGPILDALRQPSREILVIGGMTALVAVYLLKNLFLAALAWRQARFTYTLDVNLAQRLFSMYLAQPYTFHLQRNSAQLINTISGEVSRFTIAGVGPGLMLLAESVMVVGLGVLLLVVEPFGALVVGSVVALASIIFLWLTRHSTIRWATARQRHEEMALQHLQQGLGAAKDVIVLGRSSEFLAQYNVHNYNRALADQKHDTVQQFPRLALEILAITALASVTIVMVLQGNEPRAVVPTLGLFAAVAFRVLPSINRILNCSRQVKYAEPAVDKLFADLTMLTDSGVLPSGEAFRFNKQIEFHNVTYRYQGAHQSSLEKVSLLVEFNKSVGIVGPSGAGKSTLVDLLLGLLVPTNGYVSADGLDIQTRLRAWQDQIGYVPQSIFLTDDTIRRNVAFGIAETDIDQDAVDRAIRAAQLEDFVAGLPLGLGTRVGDRGVRLSGGQRQRIGIARALYHEPSILILDEATSSLDVETERLVMAAIQQVHHKKTVVIVAHRFSAVEHCDRIYRLEDGKILPTDERRDSGVA
jgi:ATP-binding cassette, subfamily B, bacterial PglK